MADQSPPAGGQGTAKGAEGRAEEFKPLDATDLKRISTVLKATRSFEAKRKLDVAKWETLATMRRHLDEALGAESLAAQRTLLKKLAERCGNVLQQYSVRGQKRSLSPEERETIEEKTLRVEALRYNVLVLYDSLDADPRTSVTKFQRFLMTGLLGEIEEIGNQLNVRSNVLKLKKRMAGDADHDPNKKGARGLEEMKRAVRTLTLELIKKQVAFGNGIDILNSLYDRYSLEDAPRTTQAGGRASRRTAQAEFGRRTGRFD